MASDVVAVLAAEYPISCRGLLTLCPILIIILEQCCYCGQYLLKPCFVESSSIVLMFFATNYYESVCKLYIGIFVFFY